MTLGPDCLVIISCSVIYDVSALTYNMLQGKSFHFVGSILIIFLFKTDCLLGFFNYTYNK